MAETLWATSHITGDCPSSGSANGEWDATWAGPTANNVAWTSRWALDDPSGPLAALTQTVTVRVRKTNHSTNPSVAVNLYEAGTLVQSLVSTTAVSNTTTGTDLSGTFDSSAITNPADVEVEVVATTGGGSPGNRASLQLDGARFVAEVATGATHEATVSVPVGADVETAAVVSRSAAVELAATATVTAGAVVIGGAPGLFSVVEISARVGRRRTPPVTGPPFITGTAGLHFTDQHGAPIAFNSDTVWALPVRAGQHGAPERTWQSDITDYMDTRGGQGYNAMLCTVLGSTANAGPFNTGATWDGVLPFVDGEPGDLNDTYWERVDWILTEAERNGMTVLANVAYSDDLDNAALAGKTNTQLNQYGAALGTRYGDRPNIVWMAGGDYFGTFDTGLANIINGIRTAGDTHLLGVQNYPETTSRRDLSNDSAQNWGLANAQFNYVYTYNVTYFGIEYAHSEASPVPVIWGDGNYDQVNTGYRRLMRHQTWWALSSGARGTNYGSEAVWAWGSSALAALTTGVFAASDLPAIIDIFHTFPGWHLLLPDLDNSLITAGRGTRASSLPSGGGNEYNPGSTQDEFVSAAVTPGGTLAVIYFPVAGEITVDDTELVASYTARWVDPVSGASTAETVGSTYTTPGNNSLGEGDWVLVLEGI